MNDQLSKKDARQGQPGRVWMVLAVSMLLAVVALAVVLLVAG